MSSGDLKPHELAVLKHIGRYRVSFAPVIQQLLTLQGVDVDAFTKSLVKRGFITQEKDKQFGKFAALSLTSKAIRTLGLEQRKSSNLGPQSKPDRISVLAYCITGKAPRLPLYPSEIEK